MLNITAGHISSTMPDHLIQFLTQIFTQTYCKDTIRTLMKQNFKNDLHKISWKEHCSNPDSNVTLKDFLQIINKLQDKHAPYVM